MILLYFKQRFFFCINFVLKKKTVFESTDASYSLGGIYDSLLLVLIVRSNIQPKKNKTTALILTRGVSFCYGTGGQCMVEFCYGTGGQCMTVVYIFPPWSPSRPYSFVCMYYRQNCKIFAGRQNYQRTRHFERFDFSHTQQITYPHLPQEIFTKCSYCCVVVTGTSMSPYCRVVGLLRNLFDPKCCLFILLLHVHY